MNLLDSRAVDAAASVLLLSSCEDMGMGMPSGPAAFPLVSPFRIGILDQRLRYPSFRSSYTILMSSMVSVGSHA